MPLRALSPRQLLGIVVVAIAIHAVTIASRRMTHAGDFDISRELGRRFLAGEHLYAGGLHYPYMPAAAMAFAPLAVMPAWLGFALRYIAALGALALTLRWLTQAVTPADAVRVIGLTLLLSAHYIVRDLDDAGPHLLLLALVVGGIFYSQGGRLVLAAAAIGLAIAVKAPHAILLVLFGWQRRWRLLLLTLVASSLWIAAPSLWMGPSRWWQHQMEWTTTVTASVRGDPLPGPRDSEERVQNQALAPAIVRIARRCDASEHARALAMLATGVTAVCLLWALRRPTDSTVWGDISAMLIAMPLLAPVAWTQHLVVVIPALMLILARRPDIKSPDGMALGLFALLTLALNREVLGRTLYLDLLTYGLHTIALLLLLATLLAGRARNAEPA